MFESLRIRNYRVFSDLEIGDLSRINLIGGKNNSGKTSLLEAIFLLAGSGNVNALMNINVLREMAADPSSTQQAVDVVFKPVFNDLDMSRPIGIEGYYIPHGFLSLEITTERIHDSTVSLEDTFGIVGMDSRADLVNENSLMFRYARNGDALSKSHIVLGEREHQIRQEPVDIPFNLAILNSHNGDVGDDAIMLGRLRQQKHGDLLLDSLRIIEPRLQSIEDNSASGSPMIWGDIGLSELVPLSVMGEGMTRIARLVLAIATCSGGVVLVDEVENGIHHSVMSKVWKVVAAAAEQFDTQIFATTHSYECVEKAREGLGLEGFHYYRLSSDDGGNQVVAYDEEALQASIDFGFEIR